MMMAPATVATATVGSLSSITIMSAAVGAVLDAKHLTVEEEMQLARDRVLPVIHAAYDGFSASTVPAGETEAVSRLLDDMHRAPVVPRRILRFCSGATTRSRQSIANSPPTGSATAPGFPRREIRPLGN